MNIGTLWQRTTTLPVVGERFGKKAFSVLYSQVAPYFSSIGATVTVLEPNHAELVIRDRRKVHNHIGTVHAIALCNGLEMAMGALAEVTVPSTKRWIPKGMTVAYTAKAAGNVTCIAETDQVQWDEAEGDLPVRVRGELADGTVVIDGTINLWVTTKKSKG
nr:hotdog fold domain-containing protein [Nocardioides sp.]